MNTGWMRFHALKTAIVAAVVCCCLPTHDGRAQAIYDVRLDWSDTVNPNGVWSYNHGTTPLPYVANWTLDSFSPPQGGWAEGSTVPFWFRSSSPPSSSYDWQIGDVVVHTQDDGHGAGHGPATVTWTSPMDGVVDVAGGVWMGRDFGRSNHWSLFLNGVLISGGDIWTGDPYDRANPYDFAVGSGGAAALNDIPVVTGDVVALQITRTTSSGDYVGVNFTVTAIPEASTSTLLALAAGFALWRRRRRSGCSATTPPC